MLRTREAPAIPDDPSDSTVLGPSEGDQSTTEVSLSSKTTASPPTITDGSSTIFPTTSRAEHTISTTESQPTQTSTVDSGTTESPPEPSSTPTTSEVEPTTRTTDSHTVSATGVDPVTTDSPPDPSSSSTTPNAGQSPTTSAQPTTTTTRNPESTKVPTEPPSSPATSKAEPTTHTTDSHSISTTTADSGTTKFPPGSSSSSTTSHAGQSPTTRIQLTTTTTGNPESSEPSPEPARPPATPKVDPTIQTTDINPTESPSPPTTSKPEEITTTNSSQPMTTTTDNSGTTKSPPESPNLPPTSTAEQTLNTDVHQTPTTADNPGPTVSPPESSSSRTTSMAGHTTDSQSTSQGQVVVTTKVPDGEQSPPQSTQLDDPRPDSTVTATPADSTSAILPDLTVINNAAHGHVPTKTSSESARTGVQIAAEQTVVPTNPTMTTIVTTGVKVITTTSIGSGTTSVFITRQSFTSTTTSLVTNGPTGSNLVASETSKAAAIAGGIVGGIMGLLILAAVLVFLRRRRRRAGNIMPYSPVETHRSSPGGVLTHELPPVRTVTPLVWPQHQSHVSIDVSVRDAGRLPAGSSSSEVATNPFEPAPSTHRLVDVASVTSSRNSFPSNPFEDNANTYSAGYRRKGSLDVTDLASGTLHEGENHVVTVPSSATAMDHAQANHNRHLSFASTDCPYPVLEPNSPTRHVSLKSGLSYATIDPERAAKLQAQPQLVRYPSISSTSSSSINIGYAV